MGMDQYLYAIKNGVYKLKEKYYYPQDYKMIDKLFVPATEIAYWRKNFPIQHHFHTNCSEYVKLSSTDILSLIRNIENSWGEFGYEDYLEFRKDYDLDVLNHALWYMDDDFSIYYEADW